MKWEPTIIDFWTTYIGARNVPLTYLIWEDPAVTHPLPALEIDRPYSAPYDSIYYKLVERVTHIHPLFTTDNQVLYGHLDASNLAERHVGLTKTSVWKDLHELDAPMVLWDFCAELRMRINNLTDRSLFQLQGQNPHLDTFGEEGDISNVCQFKWYEWAYALERADKLPNQAQFLCRVLGPTKNDGNKMAQWCLKMNGNILPRRSIFPFKTSQLKNKK